MDFICYMYINSYNFTNQNNIYEKLNIIKMLQNCIKFFDKIYKSHIYKNFKSIYKSEIQIIVINDRN